MRSAQRQQRGFSLIECTIAILLVGIGAVASAALIDVLTRSNRWIGGNGDAVALATRLIAEIEDARLIIGNPDPGLVDAAGNPISDSIGEVVAPVGGSTIRSVGRFAAERTTAGGVNTAYEVRYEVRNCLTCLDPLGTGEPSLGGLEILVSVYNADNQGKLIRPLRFLVRKEFSTVVGTGGTVRGW